MKTNVKMRVTPEQSKSVQEICFENNIIWNSVEKSKIAHNLECSCLYIGDIHITHSFSNNDYFNLHSYQEIDADLFIRTNGTCEEDNIYKIGEIAKRCEIEFDNFKNEAINTLNKYVVESTILNLEQKLKKKNEILKKARIKRKNQREELHKLNLKLQKCISFEEHNKIVGKINKDNVNYLSNNILSRDKEIEKLKVVIEYLESKVK